MEQNVICMYRYCVNRVYVGCKNYFFERLIKENSKKKRCEWWHTNQTNKQTNTQKKKWY